MWIGTVAAPNRLISLFSLHRLVPSLFLQSFGHATFSFDANGIFPTIPPLCSPGFLQQNNPNLYEENPKKVGGTSDDRRARPRRASVGTTMRRRGTIRHQVESDNLDTPTRRLERPKLLKLLLSIVVTHFVNRCL